MAATLPALTLECSGCGHRWPTRARAGSSIRCPRCRRVRRVPADRPRTDAQARAAVAAAAGDDGGLAAAWAAEQPYEPDWRKIPGADSGQPCSKCGGPMRWTGAHTGLTCPACRTWGTSPAARARAADHLAAIDNSAARKSAQLADPAAERAAAEMFAAERAELLDDLDGLAELLDVADFPRNDAEYAPARRAGIRYGGTITHYLDRARRADTLDQLRRVAADAAQFAKSITPWLDRIADLRDELGQDPDDDDVIYGEVLDDDDDDQGELTAAERRAIWQQMTDQVRAVQPGSRLPAALGAAPGVTYCARCRSAQRRIGGRWPAAVASIEAPGMVPAPVEVCADHLAEAQQQHGPALRVRRHDDFWGVFDANVSTLGAHQAVERARATTRPPQHTRTRPWKRRA